MKLKNILINLAILFCACIVGLFFTEGFFRIFKPQNIIPRYVESAPYGIRKNMGNVRGYHKTSEYDYEFNTNSQGFRGKKEYSLHKPDGIIRIIVLGDSVALGHGVADDETFAAFLNKKLNERLIKSEVINLGVSGFGTAEELIQYENTGKKYNPDIVILSYFPNDPYNNAVSNLYKIKSGKLIKNNKNYEPAINIRDNLNRVPFYNFFAQHSHLLCFVRHYFSRSYLSELYKKRGVHIYTPDNPELSVRKEYMDLTAALINKVENVCLKDNVKLIILDIPDKNLKSNFPYNLISKNDNTVILGISGPISRYSGVNLLWYNHDGHPTKHGHELIAQELFNTISPYYSKSILH